MNREEQVYQIALELHNAHGAGGHVRSIVRRVLVDARREGRTETAAKIAAQIRSVANDPLRVRPLRSDAETPTDFADDFEWAAMIAEGAAK